MPLRSDWSQAACPIARSLEVVGDPWTVLILREALLGTTRYNSFRAALGASDNVLSHRLTAMVGNGLLRKSQSAGAGRSHSAYHLTRAGADLFPVLSALGQWGSAHTAAPGAGTTMRAIHRRCGEAPENVDFCRRCGVTLTSADVSWDRTWISGDPVELAAPVE